VIFTLIGSSGTLALASVLLAFLEVVRTQPLDRPTRYMQAAVYVLVASFVVLSVAFAVLITDT